MDRLVAGWRRPRVRLAINVGIGLLMLTGFVLAGQHLAGSGWPLASANPGLATAAGLIFLAAYGVKAFGWQRLFAPHERPGPVALAVAGGAASVTGVALPGRFDDVVRVAVARKAGCRACVRTVCLSLFILGLVDALALSPLASVGAGIVESSALRAALAVVAGAGVGAGFILIGLPYMHRSARLLRFRVIRWLTEHVAPGRDAARASVLVLVSWVMRAAALLLLLGALGIGFSFPLALLFLTAAAASSALPVAPAGAATQVGAGAASLIASGVSTAQAVSFAMAAQLLVILAGAALLVAFALWQARRWVRRPRFAL